MTSSILLGKRGKRIAVVSRIPLNLTPVVPGAYQTTSGIWTVPLDLESLQLLREKYGERLSISIELERWIIGVQNARHYMATLAKKQSAKLLNVAQRAPVLAAALNTRTYQKVGARFIADNPATLIADDPGLGKTLMVLAGIIEAEADGPFLIIAPKTATDAVWRREIQRWLPHDQHVITMPNTQPQRERLLRKTKFGKHSWLIVNPEMLQIQAYNVCDECNKKVKVTPRKKAKLPCDHEQPNTPVMDYVGKYPVLFDITWGVIVVDESHEVLIRRSGVPTQRRLGLNLLSLAPNGLKIAMSGTPFDSKPHQLWGTLNWLDPINYSAFHRWSDLYWTKGGFTGFQIGAFRKDREQMLWDSLSAIALRRTKAEVAEDLPPKIEVGTRLDPTDPDSPIGIWLPMEGRQAKAYREIEELSVTELESGRLETISALSALTRLKQLACSYGAIELQARRGVCRDYPCESCRRKGWHIEDKFHYTPSLPSNKFEWVINSLEEWGYPKNPLTNVVIVSFYTGILTAFSKGIEQHFKTKMPLCTAITGKTPPQHRRTIIDKFNAYDGPRIMMLNTKAGGTAITLDTADRMIFLSETRIPDQQKQAEDRIHRVSNPRHCMYYYLRSLGTVDVGTALVNREAIAETHRLLDARRGVEYTRRVLDLSKGFTM